VVLHLGQVPVEDDLLISSEYRADLGCLLVLELRKATQATGAPPDEATRAKMMDLQSKQAAEIRAILTADQQTVFDKNLAEMKEHMAARKNGSS